MSFEELFAVMRWGTPFVRDAAVVEDLVQEGLIQPPGPLPGRFEELEYLSRMFGYGSPPTGRPEVPRNPAAPCDLLFHEAEERRRVPVDALFLDEPVPKPVDAHSGEPDVTAARLEARDAPVCVPR